MNNYKIKVNNEAESREAQDLFEQLGFMWAGDHPENGDWYSHLYAEKSSCCHLPIYVWNGLGDKFQELTIPQLRDLVVLHRNDVNDATHVTEDNEVYYLKTSVWNVWKSGWHHSENDESWFEDNVIPIKKSEQGLISWADALRALADGEEVEYLYGDKWLSVVGEQVLITAFTDDKFKFRLKPRTIKLELEIPAPFEPNHGDEIWFLNPDYGCGYADGDYDPAESVIQFGAWRTEEEIKQVVAALRGGIKG